MEERSNLLDDLRPLVEAVRNPFVVLDANLRVVHASAEFPQLLGKSIDDLSNISFLTLVHPDDLPGAEEMFSSLLRSGRVEEFLGRLQTADDWRWHQWTGIAGTTKGNESERVVLSFRNVTQQREVERALDHERGLAYRYLDAAGTILIEIDRESKVLMINRKGCEMLGLDREEIIGRSWIDNFVPEDSRRLVRKVLDDVLTGVLEPDNCAENEIICKGGELRTIAWTTRLVRNDSGQVEHILCSGEDATDRMHMEEDLRASEAKYRALSEQIIDIVYALDAMGRLTYIGPQIKRYGYSPEEMVGRSAIEFIYEEDRQRAEEDIAQSLSGEGNMGMLTFRITSADGSEIFWFEEISEIPRNEAGEVTGIVGVMRDITERKLLEEKQRESEIRYRTLFESAGDGIILMHNDRFIDCNERTLELYGRSREEFLERTPFEFSPQRQPDGRDSKESAIEKIAAAMNGIPQTFEWLHEKTDGTEFFVEVSLTHLPTKGHSYLQAIVRDVSERHRTLSALRESEQRFRLLIENVPSVCWCSDAAGRTHYISPNILSVFGFTPAEIYANGSDLWFGRIHPDQMDSVVSCFEKLTQDGERYDVEYRIQRKDGEWIWIHDQADTVMEVGDGKQVFGVFSDITERKAAEEQASFQKEQLLRADKLASLGALVAGVAHEVNNPANFVTLNAPLVQQTWCSVVPILDDYARENGDFVIGGIDYSEMRELMPELLSGLIEGGERIRNTVADLKRFATKEPPKPNPDIDINSVVAAALKLVKPQVRKVTNRFSVEYAADLPRVKGVAQQLEQVVVNLVMNACQSLQSTEDAIVLRTFSGEGGQSACLLIEDEGCGMAPEALRQVTEPFYSTRWDSDGAGLGLSISSSIVKDHGGDLTYESELGRGTQVLLRLPSVATQSGNIWD